MATAGTGFLGAAALMVQNLFKSAPLAEASSVSPISDSASDSAALAGAGAVSGSGSRKPAAITVDADDVGFQQLGTRATVRSVQSKLTEQVSVFDFMTQAQIDDVRANRLSMDTSDAIQLALNASRNVYFPEGSYRIGRKLVPQRRARLRGASPFSRIVGFHQGVILELPYVAEAKVSSLTFLGPLCTGIGVSQAVSDFTGYMVSTVVEDCAFQKDLSYGINANMINCQINKCSFGVGVGQGENFRNMVGIRSYPTRNNSNQGLDPNVNEIIGCTFYCGIAGTASHKVQLQSATNWIFRSCDFESGGPAVYSNDTSSLIFESCWFEGNSGTYSINLHLASTGPIIYRDCSLNNNKCAYGVIQYAKTVTYQLLIENCTFGLINQYPIWDQTGSNGLNGLYLPGDGYSVVWRNNVVYGANAGNRLKSTTNRGQVQQIRAWGVINTAGAGTVIASSDPDMTLGKTAAGNVVLKFPHALGSATNRICVTASSPTAIVMVQAAPSVNSARVAAVDFKNTPVDAIIHFSIMGS